MACTDVFNAFAVATESLAEDVYVLASHNSIWMDLIPRAEYKRGSGLTQTIFTVGRQEPASDEETWNPITLANDDTSANACDNDFQDSAVGYTADTYSPEKFQLQGPVICKDELIYSHAIDNFLSRYMRALGIRARRTWENRYLKLYMDFSKKGIADADFTLSAAEASFTQPISTSHLTQEMLDAVAYDLISEGATNPDDQGYMSYGETGPLFTLMIGMEASQLILKNNSEFRNDLRWGTSGKGQDAPLLYRLGATMTIKNFRHLPVIFPPRFTYDGAAYVRVNTFEDVATTKGTVSRVTAAYKAAPYEGAIVLSKHVFTSEIVRPVNSAAGMSWSPTSHMGEWKFVPGAQNWDTTCVDPLMKKARHFAEFVHAPRPEFPQFGVTLIFKRCPANSFSVVYCT